MRAVEDCTLLVEQVLHTWDPPLRQEDATMAQSAQTSFMIAMAFAMGDDFPVHKLGDTQKIVVNQGLDVYNAFLREEP